MGAKHQLWHFWILGQEFAQFSSHIKVAEALSGLKLKDLLPPSTQKAGLFSDLENKSFSRTTQLHRRRKSDVAAQPGQTLAQEHVLQEARITVFTLKRL